ncbi:SAM-dependent methyltransferase [Streptomyces sp. NPDC088732]|uniref:SAM-dependent methyltransferase n=1 Tax=Streptomyces sp. NPDC088732 TaxID=3365879 RepID=UPI00380C4AED
MTDKGFSADEIDTSRPHPARMYDYYLGGKDNYEADREAAEMVIRMTPDARPSARANRDFMRRAVRHSAAQGIRQFIDIGTGIPTSPNTHEVARTVVPDARIAYVDNDPIVAAHAGARLTNTGNAGFFLADVRDPDSILEHATLRELIDFDEPVALMLVALLHFVRDDEDPTGIVRTLGKNLPSGSRLILSHATTDFHRDVDADAGEAYKNATSTLTLRGREHIEPFFDGFPLVEPGLVQVPSWRPDTPLPETGEHTRIAFWGGVGHKP